MILTMLHLTLTVPILLLCACSGSSQPVSSREIEPVQVADVVVRPREYTGALRNPLKGFTDRGFSENNRWSTLRHSYIRWNEIENLAQN